MSNEEITDRFWYIDTFYEYALKRQEILEKRMAGEPGPWTEDPILQKYSFCNVYREDDRNTIWFRENIREPLRNDPKVLIATVAFRWFNRIETGEKIKDILLDRGWDHNAVLERVRGQVPVVTGSYIIKSPDGMPKPEGVCWMIENVARDAEHLTTRCDPEHMLLEGMWETLRGYPFMGRFMAYEVVTDLRHTYLCEQAADINTWASPGPGCTRGLGRVIDGRPEGYRYESHRNRQNPELILIMQAIREYVNSRWPEKWPRWEMREVEHTLCEYDKYRRALEDNKRLKKVFYPTTTWEKNECM